MEIRMRGEDVMLIETLKSVDSRDWLALRMQLWPETSEEEHRLEMERLVAMPERGVAFLARSEGREAMGLAEVSVRYDYVNGTESSPVGFLEGLLVLPGYRRQGVAVRLLQEVKGWVVERGCRELASDTGLENVVSQAVHERLGFEETERVVYYRMALGKGEIGCGMGVE